MSTLTVNKIEWLINEVAAGIYIPIPLSVQHETAEDSHVLGSLKFNSQRNWLKIVDVDQSSAEIYLYPKVILNTLNKIILFSDEESERLLAKGIIKYVIYHELGHYDQLINRKEAIIENSNKSYMEEINRSFQIPNDLEVDADSYALRHAEGELEENLFNMFYSLTCYDYEKSREYKNKVNLALTSRTIKNLIPGKKILLGLGAAVLGTFAILSTTKNKR